MRSPPSLSATLAAVMMLLLPLLSAARVHDDVCGGQEGQVCLGCNMVAVCLRLDGVNVTVAASALCPEGKQYCLNGTCVADMSPENDCGVEPTPSAKATSPFRCPAGFSGYLPDACDCSRYHYCQDGEGWDLACNVQPSTVYQHASAACVPAWQTPCAAAADCPADANRTYSLYGQDNTVAFRCERGVVDVLLCPANHRLDLEAAVDGQDPPCVRFCPRSGRQAVDRDDTLYYECLELGAGRTGHPVLTACPEGTRFDASLERCLLVASHVNY